MEIRAMIPNFKIMTKAELRAYVLAHRKDEGAFQALADRIYANPNPQWHQPEDTEKVTDLFPTSDSKNIKEEI
jgi:hypothetical protein